MPCDSKPGFAEALPPIAQAASSPLKMASQPTAKDPKGLLMAPNSFRSTFELGPERQRGV